MVGVGVEWVRLVVRCGCACLTLFAAQALSTPAAAQHQTVQAEQRYTVAPVRFELRPSDTVGPRRAGLICAPAGRIIWRDATPERGRAALLIARVLAATGFNIEQPSEDDWLSEATPRTGLRIFASIAALDMTACTPAYGLTHTLTRNRSLKGAGTIDVQWRIYDMHTRTAVTRVETCRSFVFGRDLHTVAEATEAGLAEATRAFAATLATPSSARPSVMPSMSGNARSPDCPALARNPAND